MIEVGFDSSVLAARMTDREKRQIPFAYVNALNETAFDVRNEWKNVMPRVFDRPTPFTLNAVLYRKATRDNPVAEVFLRNELGDAVPPAKYLQFEVQGGQRAAKRSEKLLREAGVLNAGEFWVLGRGAKADAYGNLPGSVVSAVLSDVQAQFDPTQNSTRTTRAKRARRRKRRGGIYFYNPRARGHLPRGIYERIGTGFGSAVRSVMFIVSGAHYQKRYDVFAIAREIFARRFPENFKAWMARALATAK